MELYQAVDRWQDHLCYFRRVAEGGGGLPVHLQGQFSRHLQCLEGALVLWLRQLLARYNAPGGALY